MLTTVNKSQYGTSIFLIPKKEGNVRFITNYHKLNQQLVIKTYPLTRIIKIVKKLEGFQYDTVFYINMGYYTIRISTTSQYMISIVTKFGKFGYNRLPMRM